MSDYPKYQYSKFIGQDQIVVRTDMVEEFEEMVKYVDEFKSAPKPKVSADDFENKHICPLHGTQMIERVSKNTNKPYWSHTDKVEGKSVICFGKGWK